MYFFLNLFQQDFRERTNSGGGRSDGFDDFMKNETATIEIKKLISGEIKSINALHRKLSEIGIKIKIHTLGNYVKRIKEV